MGQAWVGSSIERAMAASYPMLVKLKPKVAPDRIMQMAWGYAPPLIIETALRFGVFDTLNKSPQSAAALAKKARVSERGMTLILNALVGIQLLARKGERYLLTPESTAFLVSTNAPYYGTFFHHTTEQLIPKWMQLNKVVRTGKPAMSVNAETDGAKFFAEFVESLFPLSFGAATALGEHLQVAKAKSRVNVLDIAAGSGVWGIALAKQSRHVHMTAVDWPLVLKTTQRVAERHKLGKWLTQIPGDLMKVNYGTGHHIATLGHILHSEGQEHSRRLLKKVYNALAPGGTIAIMEFVVNDDRTGPPMGLLFAVNMLVNTKAGDTFSFKEMSGWLREAGFRKPRLLDVPAVSPLILATKP